MRTADSLVWEPPNREHLFFQEVFESVLRNSHSPSVYDPTDPPLRRKRYLQSIFHGLFSFFFCPRRRPLCLSIPRATTSPVIPPPLDSWFFFQ